MSANESTTPIAKPKAVAKTAAKPITKTPTQTAATAPAPAAVPPKPVLKAAAKKTAAKTPAKPKASKKVEAVKPAKETKPPKAKKTKMVRDSMTMPKAEYAVIEELKLRAAKLERPVKKTELLRAGIKALAAMADAGFLNALKAVPSLKTGRPNKN